MNAFVIPVVIVFLCGDLSYGTKAATYWTFAGSLAATEAVWVYALGAPLYFFIERMRKKNVSAFSDKNSLYAAGKSERQTTK